MKFIYRFRRIRLACNISVSQLTVATLRLLFIEYATSAGHHKNMYTHRNEKKRHKTLWKKHTHIKTL